MNTCLGASIEFEVADLKSANAEAAKVIYLEGYLFDALNGPAIFNEAARLAHLHGTKVALSLSDPWCAERHRAALRDFIANHVSILFGNEEEVASLYQCEANDAIFILSDTIDEVVVTRGPKGAFVGAKKTENPLTPEHQKREEHFLLRSNASLYAVRYTCCRTHRR